MPSKANFDLELYASNGTTRLTSSKAATGIAEKITYANSPTAAVDVYVRVLRISGTGNYTLSLSQ